MEGEGMRNKKKMGAHPRGGLSETDQFRVNKSLIVIACEELGPNIG